MLPSAASIEVDVRSQLVKKHYTCHLDIGREDCRQTRQNLQLAAWPSVASIKTVGLIDTVLSLATVALL